MNIPNPEICTDNLPIFVLKGLNLARHAVWQIAGAELDGAGLIAQDADTGNIAIISQTYGPKAWYMPGGGTHGTPEETAVIECQQEIRPPEEIKFSELRYLTTSVNQTGRVTDRFAVFHAEAEGLEDYYESLRQLSIAERRNAVSKEVGRLWMVDPGRLLERGDLADLNMHHALRKGVSLMPGLTPARVV